MAKAMVARNTENQKNPAAFIWAEGPFGLCRDGVLLGFRGVAASKSVVDALGWNEIARPG